MPNMRPHTFIDELGVADSTSVAIKTPAAARKFIESTSMPVYNGADAYNMNHPIGVQPHNTGSRMASGWRCRTTCKA